MNKDNMEDISSSLNQKIYRYPVKYKWINQLDSSYVDLVEGHNYTLKLRGESYNKENIYTFSRFYFTDNTRDKIFKIFFYKNMDNKHKESVFLDPDAIEFISIHGIRFEN